MIPGSRFGVHVSRHRSRARGLHRIARRCIVLNNVGRRQFRRLAAGRRIWAVPAIHGESRPARGPAPAPGAAHRAGRPRRLSRTISLWPRIPATLDELLTFRRWLMAQPGMFAYDLAFLRGSQEEMWQKLLQLQFRGQSARGAAWMLDHGVGATVESYGGDLRQGEAAAREARARSRAGPRACAP